MGLRRWSGSLRRVRALPAGERRLLLAAWALLLSVDLGLRTLGYARLHRLLAKSWPAAGASAAAPAAIARQVDRAARHHLYPMRCLQRSMVLEHLLRRAGLRAELRFGVRVAGSFNAHAWVEVDGQPLGEPGEISGRFARLLPG
jgi:hypothetical protein